MKNSFNKVIFILSILLLFNSCGIYKYTPVKDTPTKGTDRARKNVEEGRGVTLGGLTGGGNTTYEFSSSNPMWRASLETLDFLPLSVVDYSGGVIVTDWYSDQNDINDAIKISIRFLSNEVRSDSLKIIVHKRTCLKTMECATTVLDQNKIVIELRDTIIRKAAILDKEKNKK